MRRSCVVIAASIVVAAAVPLSAGGQPAEAEFGSTMTLTGPVVAAEFYLGKATDASPSEAKAKPPADLDGAPPVAERKGYLLLLAGLGVVAFVAGRRRLG